MTEISEEAAGSASPAGEATSRAAGEAGGAAESRTGLARARSWRPFRSVTRVDAGAILVYLLGSGYLTARLWRDPHRWGLGVDGQDEGFFQFVLAHAARSVTHLANPLFTDRLNAADGGVNMMANTSMLALSGPLAPVTLLAGPAVSFVVLLTLAFAATATAWYWVLSRHVVTSRPAALLGGGFCAFAPGMVSHGNAGHPNLVAQFLLPFIVLAVFRLRESGRAVRNGAVLGLLVSLQAFLNEEMLLFTAMACAVLVPVCAAYHRRRVRSWLRPAAGGLAVAAVVAGTLLAYPLWFQFAGPGHYRGLPFSPSAHVTPVAAYVAFSSESLAGSARTTAGLTRSPSEENSFLGWPLVALLAVVAAWLWRSALAVAVTATGLVFAALSFGSRLVVGGRPSAVPGPFALLSRLRPFDLVVASRFSLVVATAAGVLLALAGDRVARAARSGTEAPAVGRWVWGAALLAALVPIAPTPLSVTELRPVPYFITSGMWRQYVPAGRTLVTVPLPRSDYVDPMRWQAQQRQEFALARGYFLGPDATGTRTLFTAPERPTATVLANVARTGRMQKLANPHRQRAREDLAYWRAGVVVLARHRHERPLRQTVQALLGEPRRVADVWVWEVPR